MKLGMPTLIEYAQLEDNVRLCQELGLAFIELNMNMPLCLPERLPAADLLQWRKRTGIGFTVHLPEELDLSSFHETIRLGHVERCKQAIEWAHAAEITILNLHLNPGIFFTLPEERVWINEKYEAEFQERLMESYAELYERASLRSVELCIENACHFQYPFLRRALGRLNESFAGFRLTWDVGHDAKTGYAEQPVLLAHRASIRHMHLHDWNGKSDHQPLFTGEVPLEDRLLFAKTHQLHVVVEVKTSHSLRESVGRLRDRGYLPA